MERSPKVDALDHLVLTVSDLDATLAFYQRALGMTAEPFIVADGSTRLSLRFGAQKINLHVKGFEFEPAAKSPNPGTADLCFLSTTPLDHWQTHLEHLGLPVELGPVARTGANGPIQSLYLRDPDGNLIEIANQL